MYVHVKGLSVSSCSDSCCDSLYFQATYNLSSPSLPPGKLCYLVLRQQYHTLQAVVAVPEISRYLALCPVHVYCRSIGPSSVCVSFHIYLTFNFVFRLQVRAEQMVCAADGADVPSEKDSCPDFGGHGTDTVDLVHCNLVGSLCVCSLVPMQAYLPGFYRLQQPNFSYCMQAIKA